MSQPAGRFSQAQVLIAALFTLVFTGDMPDGELPIKGQIEPLEEEFRDITIESRRHVSQRLTSACITWMKPGNQHLYARQEACKYLRRTPTMPSALARAVASLLAERSEESPEFWYSLRPSLRLHKGAAAEVARKSGAEIALVRLAWEMPEQLDEAWHRCRTELLRIRAEWAEEGQ